jgi:RHH-type rel operon transcriptional repressor/antitoxin RelB
MPTSVRITEDTQRRLDTLAEATSRSRAFYLRAAIERGLPQIEWEYGIAQRAEDVRSGRVQGVSLDQVVQDLGLDD